MPSAAAPAAAPAAAISLTRLLLRVRLSTSEGASDGERWRSRRLLRRLSSASDSYSWEGRGPSPYSTRPSSLVLAPSEYADRATDLDLLREYRLCLLRSRESTLKLRLRVRLLSASFFARWFFHTLVATPAAAAAPASSAPRLSLDLLRERLREPLDERALDLSRKCLTMPAVAAVPSAALAMVDMLRRRLLERAGERDPEPE